MNAKALWIECLATDPLLQADSRQISSLERGFSEWRRLLPSLTPLPRANGVFLCFFFTLQRQVERLDEEGKPTPPLSPRGHVTRYGTFWHNLLNSVNSEGAWLELLGGSYIISKGHNIMGIVLFVASRNLRYLLKCAQTIWKYYKSPCSLSS